MIEQLARLGKEPVFALAQQDMQPMKPADRVHPGVRLDPDAGAFGNRDVATGMLGQPPADLLDAAVQRRTVPRRRRDPRETGSPTATAVSKHRSVNGAAAVMTPSATAFQSTSSSISGSARSENGRLDNRSPRMSLIGTQASPARGCPSHPNRMLLAAVKP